ncbi:MAG: helix-turn-helix transcriptional regulator [Bacteroidales bacterium]
MELRIKEVCKEKSMTLQKVAEIMGVNRVSLSNSINGNPTLSTLENIAKALGVEVVELFSPNTGNFTALIDCNGELHRFDSVEALKGFIISLEKQAPCR